MRKRVKKRNCKGPVETIERDEDVSSHSKTDKDQHSEESSIQVRVDNNEK